MTTRKKKSKKEKIIGGNIIGTVNYNNKHTIKVEAHRIGSEDYYIVDVVNQRFFMINV